MLEGLKVRSAVLRRAGQHLHPLLGVLQLTPADAQESDAALVARQRFLQAHGAVLQIAEDAVEFPQCVFKPDRSGIRAHDGSTRLVISPVPTRLTRTPPDV